MSRGLFVFFTDKGDPGGRFEMALGNLWGQFTSEKSRDIIYVSSQAKSLTPLSEWDVVIVWDYGDRDSLQDVRSCLAGRWEDVMRQEGNKAVIQHGGSRAHIRPQLEALAGRQNEVVRKVAYTRETYDPIYKCVNDLLEAVGAPGYEAELRKLQLMIFPPYDIAIEVLMAFLPADLEWQMGEAPKAAGELRSKRKAIEAQYENLKRSAGVSEHRFHSAGDLFKKMFDCLPNKTEEFHTTYIQLRDELLKIVDEVESQVQS